MSSSARMTAWYSSGPLGTAAPTKPIVTLRRGGCPHPPVRWPPHPTIPILIRPCGATFPIPFVPSGHFPLTRGIGPLEGGRLSGDRKGRPYGVSSTSTVGSVKPGAEFESHRMQFWGSQAPVGREETQIATQILRAGNFAKSIRYASPVIGVLGDGRHGGGRLCRTADCARPLAVLW